LRFTQQHTEPRFSAATKWIERAASNDKDPNFLDWGDVNQNSSRMRCEQSPVARLKNKKAPWTELKFSGRMHEYSIRRKRDAREE